MVQTTNYQQNMVSRARRIVSEDIRNQSESQQKPKGPTPMKRLGIRNEPNENRELTLTQLTEIEMKGQQLLALVGDLDPNNERRIIFKSRFEDLLRPYKEELRQKTDKMFSMAE